MQFKLFTPALGFLLLCPSALFAQSTLSASATAPDSAPAAAIASPAAISFGEKLAVRGVNDAGRVTEHLYRGSQPDIASLEELKKLGITTIVDLRGESSRTREAERARAEALGMRFVSIPLGGFSAPNSAQLAQFFSLLRQTPSEKIFIHCRLGHDRTGVFVASYRIAFEHWTPDQALSEMNAFGFNHTWHPSMIYFVRDLPNRLQTDPIFKPFQLN